MSVVQRYYDLVVEVKDRLTQLDEISGDGDFGYNLEYGLRLSAERHKESDGDWDALTGVFLDEIGGTSGPLFGLLFQALLLSSKEGGDEQRVLAGGLREGLAAIQRVGEAKVGDRTLVDALSPAAEVTAGSQWQTTDVAKAAVDGAAATAEIVARRGRSSYVGERALGHPDPGAVGLALFFLVLAYDDRADMQEDIDKLFGSLSK